jgi:hypothetical protein
MLWFAQGSASLFSLVDELRGHQRRPAEELEPWKSGVEEPEPLAASPAAITLTDCGAQRS